MKKLAWAKQEIGMKFADCATLQDIILKIEEELLSCDEVVCEIRVNGLLLKEEDEKRLASSKREDINEISITSAGPSELLEDTLVSTLEFIPQVQSACVKLADNFRNQVAEGGQKQFADTVSACQWLVETFWHLRAALDRSPDKVLMPARWDKAEQTLTSVVRGIMEAYEKKDHVLLADLIEYDLTATLEEWRGVLNGEQARCLGTQDMLPTPQAGQA